MRVLPAATALLVEVADLDEAQALHAALRRRAGAAGVARSSRRPAPS